MKSLLPCTATSLEKSLAELTTRLEKIPVKINTLYNAVECPSALLPWLAWAFSVDFLPSIESTQRRVIAKSLPLHQKKGTRAAVVEACARLNYAVSIIEGWSTNPPKPAHTFEVKLLEANKNYINSDYDILNRAISSMKPARSHYRFSVNLTATANVGMNVSLRAEQRLNFTVAPVHPLETFCLNTAIGAVLHIEQHLH